MDIKLAAGKYIVAVSGGVDSVVLLDLLANTQATNPKIQFIVAHFDHGIRGDSAKDAKLVQELANKYEYKFICEQGNLGPDTSEATAREARYAFLNYVQKKQGASAIITAHHQDDVIETGMINILRGTGRHGLTSLKSTDILQRPLLDVPKSELIKYAKTNKLKWNEDSTNNDIKYLRNNIRINIVPKMSPTQRQQWLVIVNKLNEINKKLDSEIQFLLRRGLHKGQLVLSRKWFTKLPHDIAKEVLMAVLEKAGASEIDKKTIERLCIQLKTVKHGKELQASGVSIMLTKRSARFKNGSQTGANKV